MTVTAEPEYTVDNCPRCRDLKHFVFLDEEHSEARCISCGTIQLYRPDGTPTKLMNDWEYLREEGRRCPYCREPDQIERNMPVDEGRFLRDELRVECLCWACKREWEEVYLFDCWER